MDRSVTSLTDSFVARLGKTRLILPGQRIVVAISGGLDSVLLLHLLRFAIPDWAVTCLPAHFDHQMRPCSKADADWVAGLCRAWELPLATGIAHNTLRSENEARDARYQFLHSVYQDSGAHCIATGHHADDQAETLLFRAIRGTGLHGLAGIPLRRGPVVRPLLHIRRAELEACADFLHLACRIDPTNAATTYARNRIRHEILPRLNAIVPGSAANALARLAGLARANEDAWNAAIEELLPQLVLAEHEHGVELARPKLLSYHPQLRARVLRFLLRRFDCLPDRAGTGAALQFTRSGVSGTGIRLAGGVILERELDSLSIRSPKALEMPADVPLYIAEPGNGSGEALIGGMRFRTEWRLVQWPKQDFDATPGHVALLDAADLCFPLELRGRRAGDRVRLAYGTKKLKKLFLERRMGRESRVRAPVLADSTGEVLWVVGVARSVSARPRGAGMVLELRVTLDDGG